MRLPGWWHCHDNALDPVSEVLPQGKNLILKDRKVARMVLTEVGPSGRFFREHAASRTVTAHRGPFGKR